MKKLKLQVQMTIDGYVAGLNSEMDWMVWDWDDELKHYVTELTDSVDTILLGRKMTDGFISSWSNVASNPNNPEYTAAKKFLDMPKVVFTKTLKQSTWENTAIATGDLADEVARLKNQSGKDMIVYGGASFVASLIKEKLIDEFHLFVNPAVLGEGLTIFKDVDHKQGLRLVNVAHFECGIALLHYEPERS